MATVYGSALGLDSTGLLIALFGYTDRSVSKFNFDWTSFPDFFFKAVNFNLHLCIFLYFNFFAIFFMSRQLHFWILALMVGMFQGRYTSFVKRVILPK